jgi:hypothetical protein
MPLESWKKRKEKKTKKTKKKTWKLSNGNL